MSYSEWYNFYMTVILVTHSGPTSEVGGSNPEPYVGKMVVSYRWLQFTVQNLDQLYLLVSSAHKTTHRDMTYTMLKATLKPK